MTSSTTSDGLLATASRLPNDVVHSSTEIVPLFAEEDVTDLITMSSADIGGNVDVDGDDSSSSSAVGIAIGVSITCAVVLIALVVLIYVLVRRRHKRRREKSIVRIENPQYKIPEDEHHLTAEVAAATLSTAPTVKFTANTNASLMNSSNGRKKKEDAPLPPIYRPPQSASATSKTKEFKREAPQPPPPQSLHLDLYEKDSPTGGSMEDLTSATNVTTSPAEEIAGTPGIEVTSHSPHLIASPSDGSNRQLSPNRTSAKRVSSNSQVSNEHEDIGCSDDLTGADLKTALLGPTAKLSNSRMSLDSYDKTLNPFFTSNT